MKKQTKKQEKKKEKNEKIKRVMIVLLIAISMVIVMYILKDKYNEFEPINEINEEEISCIAEKSILYISKTCRYCNEQKEILRNHLNKFKIVECTDKENSDGCSDISSIPTWKINGEYYSGKKSLDELKSLTDCYQEKEKEKEKILTNGMNISKQMIVEDCKNLSLEKTAYCLRDNTKKFYIYNKTEDSLNLTFEELVERGGDCRNWAFFYADLTEKLGFRADTIHIPRHRYATIDSRDGNFCVLNMLRVECFI